MEVTYVNPVGTFVVGLVLVGGVVILIIFKFVIKFRSDLFSAYYWTETKFEQRPGVSVSLLADRVHVEFNPLFKKSSFEILYAAIEAFGREPADMFSSTVFIVAEHKTHYFAPNRAGKLVQELSRRIDAYKMAGPRESDPV